MSVNTVVHCDCCETAISTEAADSFVPMQLSVCREPAYTETGERRAWALGLLASVLFLAQGLQGFHSGLRPMRARRGDHEGSVDRGRRDPGVWWQGWDARRGRRGHDGVVVVRVDLGRGGLDVFRDQLVVVDDRIVVDDRGVVGVRRFDVPHVDRVQLERVLDDSVEHVLGRRSRAHQLRGGRRGDRLLHVDRCPVLLHECQLDVPDRAGVHRRVGLRLADFGERLRLRPASERVGAQRHAADPLRSLHFDLVELGVGSRWVVGAYDKTIPWADWLRARYQPAGLGDRSGAQLDLSAPPASDPPAGPRHLPLVTERSAAGW
jgi:hypothetical protein